VQRHTGRTDLATAGDTVPSRMGQQSRVGWPELRSRCSGQATKLVKRERKKKSWGGGDRENAGERERDGLGVDQHPGWRANPGRTCRERKSTT